MNHNAGATHVTIRPLAARDRADWAEMWSDYLAFYETELGEDIYALTFERLLSDDHPDMFGKIATVDDAPAGIVHCILHAHCWKAAPVCYLQDLFTRAEMRGRGVARTLIESVYADADTRGAANTYWMTQDFNHTARKLYDRIGELTPFIKYQQVTT